MNPDFGISMNSGSQFNAAGNGPQNNNTGSGIQYNNVYIDYEGEQDRKCLRDLRLSDPRDDKDRIKRTKRGLFRGASDWILNHDDYLRWKNGEARLLWIKGDPGKGKTMLLINIVEELDRQLEQSDNAAALSYFFCQGTHEDLNNATAILRGLIYLLVIRRPVLISHLRTRYDHAGPKLFQDMNSFDALLKVLGAILLDKGLTQVYLVVDALDECTPANRDRVLEFIVHHAAISSSVKWIISSRNRPEIEQYLTLDSLGTKLGLEITQNAEIISRAVDAFIDFKLSNLRQLRDENKMRHLRNRMREKASGTFLWVALVAEKLQSVPEWRVLEAVEQIPAGLNELYGMILVQIQQQEDWEFCQRLLSITTMAYRPLHIAELAILSGLPEEISTNLSYVRGIVALCGSLLTLQENDVVYLIHQSAKDYLGQTAAGVVFPTGQAEVHRGIVDLSLQAMRGILRRNIYGICQPGSSISDCELAKPDPDPLATIRYSCVYWISHYCDSYYMESFANQENLDGDKLYSEAIDQFLRRFYLYWLEALSLLRQIGEGVLLLARLRDVVRSRFVDQHFIDLVQDLYRFIYQNRWIIENAPLQIYASALLFSPGESLIRSLYLKEIPEWIKIRPRVERTWGSCQQTLEGHRGWVYSVAFSPDSKLLASGGNQGLFSSDAVKIWNAATGSLEHTLRGDSKFVNSVAFSPNSKLVAAGTEDETIEIWDAMTGALEQTLKYSGYINAVSFSPDSKLLASCSHDETVQIWNAVTWVLQYVLKGHSNSVRSVVFSPDSKLLASGSRDMKVKIWEVAAGSLYRTFEGHSSLVYSVAFSLDSRLVASGSEDYTVKIWDVATGALYQTFEGHSRSVQSVAFSPDSRLVASGSVDTTVKIWNVATEYLQQTIERHSRLVTSVAFSPDSKLLASGSMDRTVKIWDAVTGTLQKTLRGHRDWVRDVAFSPDSKLIASTSHDYTVKIWSAVTGALQKILTPYAGSIDYVPSSPNLEPEASGSGDSTPRFKMGELEMLLYKYSEYFYFIAFSPDSELIASVSSDHTVFVWDATTGFMQQALHPNDRHKSGIYSDQLRSILFSPDSRLIAYVSDDNTLQIWDATTGVLQQTLEHSSSDANVHFPNFGSRRDSTMCNSYGISNDRSWVTWNGQNILWLPTDYRHAGPSDSCLAPTSASSITSIALGMDSGRVVIIGLLSSGPMSN